MQEELYRKLYAKLCAGISEAIDLLKIPGKRLYAMAFLQKTLWEAEDMYIQQEDAPNHPVDS